MESTTTKVTKTDTKVTKHFGFVNGFACVGRTFRRHSVTLVTRFVTFVLSFVTFVIVSA